MREIIVLRSKEKAKTTFKMGETQRVLRGVLVCECLLHNFCGTHKFISIRIGFYGGPSSTRLNRFPCCSSPTKRFETFILSSLDQTTNHVFQLPKSECVANKQIVGLPNKWLQLLLRNARFDTKLLAKRSGSRVV